MHNQLQSCSHTLEFHFVVLAATITLLIVDRGPSPEHIFCDKLVTQNQGQTGCE